MIFRLFENSVDPYRPYPETDAPPRRLWPFMLGYARPFRRLFAFATVVSSAVAAVEIGLIYYMGRVVDLLSESTPARLWSDHGVELILVGAFILLIRPALQALNVLILNNAILPNFETLIRWRAHRQVLRQSVGWFENDLAGRVANRIMQTPPAAGEAVYEIIDAVTFAIAYLVGAVVLLSEADPRLAIPLLVWLALYGLLMRWTMVRVGPASQKASDARSEVTGRVVDSYTNIHAVKLFAHHDGEIRHAGRAIQRSRETFQEEMRIYTWMDVGLTTLNGFLIIAVVGWSVGLWMGGAASVGAIAAASALTLRLNSMTGWIMWALTSLFQNLGIVSEGMETIAQPITIVDRPDAGTLEVAEGEIVFDGVIHHYGQGRGGLDGVSLRVAPGERVGIVGRSGAGKSTLVKLLLRFYDAEAGAIRIDGRDIGSVTQDSLRLSIGMVQQDSSLLHRSIRENILYGRPDATEEEIRAAADRAHASEFIATLRDPDGKTGYEARVGERGVKLSGGQRQRIALARVILKDAPILVLDEATSALDSEIEAAIQDTLYGVMEGKTVIAIAHRLSTIARMDRIVVLDEGRVVEEGTHAELERAGGLYARFWRRQAGGFIQTDPNPG